MTNADKIRKKITDDDGLLDEIGTRCDRCIYGKGECIAVGGADCTAGCLEWLREEADKNQPELIDRQELLEKMRDCEAVTHSIGYLDVIAIIEDAPAIESKPVKRGEWIDNGEDRFICSACKGYVYRWFGKSDFCPRCSADMRKEAAKMSEYHVGCGVFGIYAGTLNRENLWREKSEVTNEAICAVAAYLLQENKIVRFEKNGKLFDLKVQEVSEDAGTD